MARWLRSAAFTLALGWPLTASALTLTLPTQEGSLVGEPFTLRAVAADAVGAVQYRWSISDGTELDFGVGAAELTHTFAEQGRYNVRVSAQDESGGFDSLSLSHTAHYPLTAVRPNCSSSIIFDAKRDRIFAVNQDNDSISAIDPVAKTKLSELPVYGRPEALALSPAGKLWVVHRDDYAIAIVDPDGWSIEQGFRLPYASQPMAIAFSPTGDAAYVTLMAVGKLLKLDPTTGQQLAEVDVGPSPRGLSVSADGLQVYVTRFISPDSGGEVVQVDATTLSVARRMTLAPDTTTPDSDQGARGLPNYLFAVGITPDAREAWIPAKKDNIFRGGLRDGAALNQDNTVRPMVGVLDLTRGLDVFERRIDLDDRSLPIHVEFSPQGDYGFVALAGSNLVEARDRFTGIVVASLNDAGMSPRASVLDSRLQLFVQSALSRSVAVYDVRALVTTGDSTTPAKLAEISTIQQDATEPQLLLGKRIFNNAADPRMTSQSYLTCAVCHFDGGEDGRVFDFTSRGEGFRNTTTLLGRRGTGQGPVHWSGDFDEIQDFEQEIRELFSGKGFMTDEALASGTRKEALGDPKAGASAELDALAAYVSSLDRVNPSPYRNPDGTLTADAVAGQALFGKLGCDFCHVGRDSTDSDRKLLHDVGTLKPSSGTRAGTPLLGIDTPSLLGVWETAPYLHDGSAVTLRDVLVTSNAEGEHGYVSALQPAEIDQLVAYLQQLDSEVPSKRLPFEPPPPEATGGAGGAGGSAAGSAGAGAAPLPPGTEPSCQVTGSGGDPRPLLVLIAIASCALGRRRLGHPR